MLNKYLKCSVWRLALRHDIYIYIYIYIVRLQKVKECGQDGVGIRLVRVYDLATTKCAKAFISYIRATVSAPTVLAANVFGTGILR